MRKKLLKILKCPNSNNPELKIFGAEVNRNAQMHFNIENDQLLDDDDIVNGVIICTNSNTAFPISEHIAILLSDADVDINHHRPLLEKISLNISEPFKSIIKTTLERITRLNETKDGKWNREEMRYYDKEINTAEQRVAMLHEIKNTPIWRIFIPRTNHIIKHIALNCKNQNVLEIGCGNSRTVSWAFHPEKFHYNYVGTDISFKRLLVAKKSIPEGDFIQASALNLPFVTGSFYALISFGMLHHLPRPDDAIRHCAPLIVKDGYFAFHEPITRPEVKMPGLETFKKVMSDYQHSEHDGKIEIEPTLNTFNELGFSVLNIAKEISTLRSFTETILKRISRETMKNKTVIKTITMADKLVLGTVGKISKRAGASAVFAVMKKDK